MKYPSNGSSTTGVGDLMEFICLEDNEYGQAAQIKVGTGTDGKK